MDIDFRNVVAVVALVMVFCPLSSTVNSISFAGRVVSILLLRGFHPRLVMAFTAFFCLPKLFGNTIFTNGKLSVGSKFGTKDTCVLLLQVLFCRSCLRSLHHLPAKHVLHRVLESDTSIYGLGRSHTSGTSASSCYSAHLIIIREVQWFDHTPQGCLSMPAYLQAIWMLCFLLERFHRNKGFQLCRRYR
jgi:hypothetical protein